ncbi:VCBS repeat-containing protein [Catalinimonas sp. 4WD22]|uniref:FG-GAP repeat domain-containing protein n=1 Tax=Catalinimonas locisalis TaxID=3133978 RepID=UPI003100D68C
MNTRTLFFLLIVLTVSISFTFYSFRILHPTTNLPEQITTVNPTSWKHYSTETGDLAPPNTGNQQTASLVCDLDMDGIQDFVITERTQAPSVVWYKKQGDRWERSIIEDEALRIEAGSAHLDIDGDGDLDIVFGGESRSNEVWWWENPYPDFSQSWKRYTIKKSGKNKHHDQLFGDFDGDGLQELVFWNQQSQTLFLAEIPSNPKTAEEWPLQKIYTYSTDSEMEQLGQEGYPAWKATHEHEGLAKADINQDGIEDIIGGGRYFTFSDDGYHENIIDASYTFTRAAAGQFIEGGRPEVILVVGDGVAPMMLYEWQKGTWTRKSIIEEVDNGHTLQVVDFNQDGHPDIFTAEMRFGEENPDAKTRVLLGDGKGNFQEELIATGFGVHEGRMVDLDGDGDYDVLGKPYTWKAPRLDIWINEGAP